MMNIIEVEQHQVHLSGITLNSSITIRNQHEILAIIFEIECVPPILQIEPEKGMIMQRDSKYIKLRLKPQLREQAHKIEMRKHKLVLRATYYCEYNKKIMEKNRMRGWSQLAKQLQQIDLPVTLNFENQLAKVKSSIKRDKSLHSSQHSHKMNSFQKFRDSSIKRVKNSRLNEDLDFIFRNQQFKKKSEQQKNQQLSSKHNVEMPIEYKSRTDPNAFKVVPPSQLFLQFAPDSSPSKYLDFSPELTQKKEITAQKESKMSHFQQKPIKVRDNSPFNHNDRKDLLQNSEISSPAQKSRAFQLIILAVIAAIFLALGESLGNVLK